MRAVLLSVPLLLVATTGFPQPAARARVAALEPAGYEDYRVPVGRMEGGVLRITLEARAAEWRPWGPDGPAVLAHVYAADGAPPRVPAPLIRATAGTPLHVTIRNRFPHRLVVRGLRGAESGRSRAWAGGASLDSVVVEPLGTAEIRTTPAVPGTFVYGGRVASDSAGAPPGILGLGEGDRALFGVMVVDPSGTPPPPERIFLITHWGDPEVPSTFLPATRFFINGRSWPLTERLSYTLGDTVRWRVLNMSGRPHPLHLHGFYFRVDARGTPVGDRAVPHHERRLVVTETLAPVQTMRLSWVPEEPGNWIFHCHLMRHMSRAQAAPSVERDTPHPHHRASEGADLMGGLVLGITVRPRPGSSPSADLPRRRLALHIGKRAGVFGEAPAYGFVLQEGPEPPAADSVRFPGSPLVLTRGEPTEIVVHNRADVPLGVHWHGLELESWADGVPGWSGYPGAIRPPVAPGDSFAVRMTPPRAGTFMYHVHSEPGHQLAQGLYGPFLVMRAGESWDPETDRVFLLGSLGTGEDPPPAVNGELAPGPIELRAGTTYRLRFMHISPDDQKRVHLLAGDRAVEWRSLAKDGADLPPALARTVPAELEIHVGETYDFLWTPLPGEFTLRIVTTFDRGAPAFPRQAPPPHTQDIRMTVR